MTWINECPGARLYRRATAHRELRKGCPMSIDRAVIAFTGFCPAARNFRWLGLRPGPAFP